MQIISVFVVIGRLRLTPNEFYYVVKILPLPSLTAFPRIFRVASFEDFRVWVLCLLKRAVPRVEV